MKLDRSYTKNTVCTNYYQDPNGNLVSGWCYGCPKTYSKILKEDSMLYSFEIAIDENNLVYNATGIQEFLLGDTTYGRAKVHLINKKGIKSKALTRYDNRLDNLYDNKQECIDAYKKTLNEYRDKYQLKLLSFKDELYGSIDIIDKKLKEL